MEKKFNMREYWNNRYNSGGNSGAGSYYDEAQVKGNYINKIIANKEISKILDIGVGDGNQLLYIKGFDFYLGYDISPKAIRMCEQTNYNSRLNYKFTSEIQSLPNNFDLCMCIDVLFHQVNPEDYWATLMHLFNINDSKYVLLYTTSYTTLNQAPHVFHRNVIEDVKSRFSDKYELIETLNVKISDNKFFLLYKNKNNDND